jgi:hypothetical protein
MTVAVVLIGVPLGLLVVSWILERVLPRKEWWL